MTEGTYHFPLRMWQESPEYAQQKAVDEARARLAVDELIRQDRSSANPEVSYFETGAPAVWKTTNTPYYVKARSAQEALVLAKENGASGWYSVDALEEFAKGGGVIFDEEMHRLGFRPHKNDSSVWVRRGRSEGDRPYHRAWQELHEVDFEEVDEREADKLRGLATHPNTHIEFDRTYSVVAGRTGLVYIALNANPFHLNAYTQGRLNAQKGHIDRNQREFTMVARNVKIPEGKEAQELVHIKATAEDQRVVEVVWPSATDINILSDVAVDLRDRAQGRKVFQSA